MKNLGSLISLANLRRSGSLYVFYIILEFMFFWDVHALDLLERWKEKNGGRARQWFSDLGQMEALAAIAKLAGDEPEWEFPTVFDTAGDSEVIVAGDQVGHPLLDESRVCNDVQLGPVGTVLLVTGSNMSGKSTLLRSIGANIVLAQLGSVVCSKNFRTPPVRIETSMRIADSLADGVSFFMAELKRLKEIVDTAKEHASDNPRRLLFLLDEILQGTNSVERQVAVSRVVRKLIDEKAIGAISTHDLDLADTSELAAACQTVHFSEQFVEKDGKKTMTFDYQMKPGIAQTTNALKLLEIVGLGD
jgi:DNA mismatch repair ATPase MutS